MAKSHRPSAAGGNTPPADRASFLFDLPAHLEHVPFPAPYEAHWADMILDLPERQVTGTKMDVLARVVQAWNLCLADGTPAPITAASLTALFEQAPPLFLWLYDEWLRRRSAPLAVPRMTGSSAPSPAPSTSNGHSPPTPTPS